MPASVIEYDNVGMNPEFRCETKDCGAQAFVGVLLPSGGEELRWCAHHFRAIEDSIKAIDGAVVSDHRKFLLNQEAALRK